VAACLQHPDREAEVLLSFYDKPRGGGLTQYGLCHNCRHALDIAALVHQGLITPDYEIIDISVNGVSE